MSRSTTTGAAPRPAIAVAVAVVATTTFGRGRARAQIAEVRLQLGLERVLEREFRPAGRGARRAVAAGGVVSLPAVAAIPAISAIAAIAPIPPVTARRRGGRRSQREGHLALRVDVVHAHLDRLAEREHVLDVVDALAAGERRE